MTGRADVIVVGGGPAGSTVARALTGCGADVLLIDKQRFPRDKTCAGWVTPAVLASLGIEPAEYAAGHVLQPIHGFEIGLAGEPTVRNDHGPVPVSYGIRRCEFDSWLLRRCGARVIEGEPVRALSRAGGLWRVNDTWEAPLLVGAGGHFCPVARALGGRLGRGEPVVAAQEVEFELDARGAATCGVDGRYPLLLFCRDLRGYGWVFRKGGFLNVGLGRQDNHALATHVAAFWEELRQRGVLGLETPARHKGHAYLLYPDSGRPLVGEGAVLVGDAAGLAYPQSGEGIRPAVESALLAARALAAGGDAEALAGYEQRMRERFGARRTGSPEPVAPGPLRRRLARLALRSRWFTRRVVAERWFLHQQQAPLLPGTS